MRYGEYSKPGEFVYDHPFLWGSRRIGPDLQRDRRQVSAPLARAAHGGPALDHAAVDHAARTRGWRATPSTWRAVERGVAAQVTLGVPYTRGRGRGRRRPRAGAGGSRSPARSPQQGGPAGLEETQVVALIAYLQRLGTDIKQADRHGRGRRPAHGAGSR